MIIVYIIIVDVEALSECTFERKDEIEGIVSNDDINQTYVAKLKESQLSLDCLWMIEVQPGWQVKCVFFFFSEIIICHIKLQYY